MAALIAWNNKVANFPASSTIYGSSGNLSVGTLDGSYPGTNVLDPDPSKFARFNYVRDATVGGFMYAQINLAASAAFQVSARVYAFLNVRIPSTATDISVRCYTWNGAGIQHIMQVTPANLVLLPGTTDRYNIIIDMGTSVGNIGMMMLLVYVPVSTTDYVDIGHLWLSDALVFDDGVGPLWKHGVVDPSPVERARGGAMVAQQLPRRRKLTCEFDSKTYAQAMGTAGSNSTLSYRHFMQEAGNSMPCIVIPRSPDNVSVHTATDHLHLGSTALYASFTGQHEIGHLGGNLFRSTGTFEEIR